MPLWRHRRTSRQGQEQSFSSCAARHPAPPSSFAVDRHPIEQAVHPGGQRPSRSLLGGNGAKWVAGTVQATFIPLSQASALLAIHFLAKRPL